VDALEDGAGGAAGKSMEGGAQLTSLETDTLSDVRTDDTVESSSQGWNASMDSSRLSGLVRAILHTLAVKAIQRQLQVYSSAFKRLIEADSKVRCGKVGGRLGAMGD